jgi:hypothetical protein
MILGGGMDLPITKKIYWRLFQIDYVWAQHNFADFAAAQFSNLRRPEFEGTRLRTGIVIAWGGAPAAIPAAACSIQPTEVLVGEPLSATVAATNFNPKHSVTYSWTGNRRPDHRKRYRGQHRHHQRGSGQLHHHGDRDRPEGQ